MSVKCFFIYVCGLLWWFFRLKMYFVFCLGLIIFEYFWWFSIVWSFFLVNRGFWFKKEILVYLEKLVIYVNVFFVLVDVFIGYLWMGFYIDKKNVFIKMNLICFNILYERFFEYCFDVLVWFSYDVIIVIFEELFVL